MAVLPPKKGSQRRPSMRGNMLQDTTRGIERNRIWPEKRGSRQTREQRDQTDWFRQANWAFKLMDPKSQAILRNAAEGTSLYPRDVFSIMASNGLFAFVTDDRKVAYPMATIQAVSESLDAITQKAGYTLIRGPQFWAGAPPQPGTGALSTRVIRSAPLTITGFPILIPFDKIEFDEVGLFSNAEQDRFTVPEGVLRLELTAGFTLDVTSSRNVAFAIQINGVSVAGSHVTSGYGDPSLTVSTGPINVSPGDIIQVRLNRSGAGATAIQPIRTFMAARFG